jgi:hypothetical protein
MGDEATLIAAALDDRYVIERELAAVAMAVDMVDGERKQVGDDALKVGLGEL